MTVWRSLLPLSTAALCLAAGLPAAAQTPATPPTAPGATPGAADAPAPTSAPPTASDAQPAPETAAAPAPAKRRTAQEELTVTGSRVRRKDLTTPAPVTVLSHEQLQESGKLTIGDFLQTLPEQGNSPNFQLNNGGATPNTDGGTRINLRSLGTTRTLVLVNGRRMVPSGLGASATVDLNSIPSAAVERVEVLKDGASAIYGSDAIAGVVNVITRRGFEGTEGSATYGISQHGDAQTFDAQVTTGTKSDTSSVLFSVGYFNQKASWLRDRSWSDHALTYDYTTGKVKAGGSAAIPAGDFQLPATAATDPKCNARCKAVIGLDPAGWANDIFVNDPSVPGAGAHLFTNADRYNYAAENYLTTPSTRIQAYSSGDTRLGGSGVRGYYEMSYVTRSSDQNAAPMPLYPSDYNINVSKDNQYNPFGVDLPFVGRRLVEFGRRGYSQELSTFRVVTGLDGTLSDQFGPLSNWFWDLSLNYGRTSGNYTTTGALRNSRVADAVGPSMMVNGVPTCVRTPGDATTAVPGCVPLNLFGGPGSIDPGQIEGLGYTGTSRAYDGLTAVAFNTTGDLFQIVPERPVQLALGYEFRRQAGSQIADPVAQIGDSADTNFKSTNGHFVANEAYGELSMPLLANLPAVQELEASVAGRFVNYDTFGSNFSYKLGARYTPVRDLTVRGTYSTAFRAPSISELFLGQADAFPIATDPCNYGSNPDPAIVAQCRATGVNTSTGDPRNQVTSHVGGNSKLQPETARIFTTGVVIQPRMVRDLSLTVDYYNIKVDHLVGNVGGAQILAACYPGAGGTPNTDECALIHRNGAGLIQFINDFNQNLGSERSGGLDLAVRYALPIEGAGRLRFSFDGNYLAFYTRDQFGGAPIDGRGNYDLGVLPKFKANAGVNWAIANVAAGVVGRYVGNIRECAGSDGTSNGGLCYANPGGPFRDVGQHAEFDLHASYAVPSPLGRSTLLVGVNNVFDVQPQLIYSALLANSDPSAYDYLGRYFYARLQHSF